MDRPEVPCWACKGTGRLPLAAGLLHLLSHLSQGLLAVLRQVREQVGWRTAAIYSGLRRLLKFGLVVQGEKMELGPNGRYHPVGTWRGA